MPNHNNESQTHYEKLFNLSPDIMCVIGSNNYFIKVNPAFANLLEYSEEYLLSKSFDDFLHPDDIKVAENKLKIQKNNQSRIINFENRFRTQNGTFRTLAWSANIDITSGDLYCVARDITNERYYKKQLSQIFDVLNTQVIISKTDVYGNIIEINDKFCEISGYSQAELLGNNHRIVNSGKHSKWFFKNMWETISSGNVWAGKIQNRAKNGSFYFVQTIITPLFDQRGKIEHYLSIRFDITKEISNKKALTKINKNLNEMSQISKVGGWELDLVTNELSWTDETFRILEIEKKGSSQPNLKEAIELYVGKHQLIIDEAVRQASEFGTPFNLELLAKTGKSNELWVYANGKANYENGKIVSLSGTIQDIDLRKTAEIELEQQRIKTIHNAKLASLGELSASIAHEINNPLAIIDGTARMLPKIYSDKEKCDYYLQQITKSCTRIARIVNSLKKFARTNDERCFVQVPLKNIIEESVILTETKAKRNSVKITTNINVDSSIWCDEIEIEQVLVNLINNAIDAIKNSSQRWINIEVTETPTTVTLKVIDSGTNIDPKLTDKFFDPFFTTKTMGEGTGLGLSITKGILDEHQAEIELITIPNTCFIVTFYKNKIKK